MWLGVVAFIALVFSYNFFVKNKAVTTNQDQPDQQKTYQIEAKPSDANSLPQDSEEVIEKNQRPSDSHVAETGDIKTYKNSEYEFEFTYPASLGDVAVKKHECPTGFVTVGSFSSSANIDFGYSSTEYKECKDLGFALFKTVSLEAVGNKIKLYMSDTDKPPVEVTIEQTIGVAGSSYNPYRAYIIKNTLDAGGNGDPTVISNTPHPDIGALVFRTHGLSYPEGVKLLENIIK